MPAEFERGSIVVLGSGTSVGVPMIGCKCKVCLSTDPHDKRLRPSVLLKFDEKRILIDTSPDLRYQALRAQMDRLDAVLYTHSHADHILGLDDVRPFNFKQRERIAIFASAETLADLERIFSYAFDSAPVQSTRPRLSPHLFADEPFAAAGIRFVPVRVAHGEGTSYGFRFGDCAYLTDHSKIPEESMHLLADLDVLFLDALRHNPHPTHSTVEESLQTVALLKPKRAYFTHVSHDLMYATVEERLPANVHLAYDGLEIEIGRSETE